MLDAPPIPAKNDSGTLITNAHGQDTTKNVSALFIHCVQLWSISDGITARSIAATTTLGV